MRIALSRDTVQHLLFQLGLPHVVVGEGEIFARVEEDGDWVRIGLIVPKRAEPMPLGWLRRDPPRGASR